jgi:hypothetical protein
VEIQKVVKLYDIEPSVGGMFYILKNGERVSNPCGLTYCVQKVARKVALAVWAGVKIPVDLCSEDRSVLKSFPEASQEAWSALREEGHGALLVNRLTGEEEAFNYGGTPLRSTVGREGERLDAFCWLSEVENEHY